MTPLAPDDPCASSLEAARPKTGEVVATATSCWGAWGRTREASQADVRAWLAYWERTWLGPPVEDLPGRIRYDSIGTLALCRWHVVAEVVLATDHRLQSSFSLDIAEPCGMLLAPLALRRVRTLGAPFAATHRDGSEEPGAF